MRTVVSSLGLFAVLLAGCSDGTGLKTYPVSGKVVGPGGKPWAGGRVTFTSVADQQVRATGEIGPDGGFALTTYVVVNGQAKTQAGAVAGEHTVTLEPAGGKVDRDGESKTPPLTAAKKAVVGERNNDLTVEAPKAVK
jgi:hypothetical protein